MKNIFKSFIITYSILIFTACKTDIDICKIDLLLCLSPSANKLSKEQMDLLLPIKLNKDIILLPQGSVFNTGGTISYIKPVTWGEGIRKNITSNTSIGILSQKIKNHLTDLDVSKLEIKSKISIDSINKYINNYDFVLGYSPKSQNVEFHSSITWFTVTENIPIYIVDSILSKSPDAKILIVFDMPVDSRKDTIRIEEPGNDNFVKRLHLALLDLGLNKLSSNERYKQVPSVLGEFFEKESYIKRVAPISERIMEVYERSEVEEYLYSLTAQITLADIKIIKVDIGETGKLRGVTLAEIK